MNAAWPEQTDRKRCGLAAVLRDGAVAASLPGCAVLLRNGPAGTVLEFDDSAFVQPPTNVVRPVALAPDVVYPPHQSDITSPISMLFQSLIVFGWRQALAERQQADLVITPEIRTTTTQLGLGSRGWLIETGERAAQACVVEIRNLFATA